MLVIARVTILVTSAAPTRKSPYSSYCFSEEDKSPSLPAILISNRGNELNDVVGIGDRGFVSGDIGTSSNRSCSIVGVKKMVKERLVEVKWRCEARKRSL